MEALMKIDEPLDRQGGSPTRWH